MYAPNLHKSLAGTPPSDNKERWALIDRFNSTYWSGLDVKVYADSVYLDEAIQLNYQIVEQVRPYYGYASYIPDRMHHGSRIVSGELSINFKRDGYIFSLLNLIRSGQSADRPTAVPVGDSSAGAEGNRQVRPAKPFMFFQSNTDSRTSLNNIKEGNVPPEVIASYRDSMKAPELSEADVNAIAPTVPQNFGIFETRIDGFDLNIIFGSSLKSGATLRFNTNNQYFSDSTTNLENTKDVRAGTGIRLVGVSFMGIAKSIGDDGRPIIETYSFQARDIQPLDTTFMEKN